MIRERSKEVMQSLLRKREIQPREKLLLLLNLKLLPCKVQKERLEEWLKQKGMMWRGSR